MSGKNGLIGDATPAEIRLAIVEAMIKLAGHGSVPAATAAAKLVDELESAQLQHEYKIKMSNSTPAQRVEYLASLGVSPKDCLELAQCKNNKETQSAFNRGQNQRLICARIAEQRQAHKTARIPDWMSVKFKIQNKQD